MHMKVTYLNNTSVLYTSAQQFLVLRLILLLLQLCSMLPSQDNNVCVYIYSICRKI